MGTAPLYQLLPGARVTQCSVGSILSLSLCRFVEVLTKCTTMRTPVNGIQLRLERGSTRVLFVVRAMP